MFLHRSWSWSVAHQRNQFVSFCPNKMLDGDVTVRVHVHIFVCAVFFILGIKYVMSVPIIFSMTFPVHGTPIGCWGTPNREFYWGTNRNSFLSATYLIHLMALSTYPVTHHQQTSSPSQVGLVLHNSSLILSHRCVLIHPLSWKCRRRVVSARPPIWHVSCRHADMPMTHHEMCHRHVQCRDLPKMTSEDICPDALALHQLCTCRVAKYANTWLRLTRSHGVRNMLAAVQNKATWSDGKTCPPTCRRHFQLS